MTFPVISSNKITYFLTQVYCDQWASGTRDFLVLACSSLFTPLQQGARIGQASAKAKA